MLLEIRYCTWGKMKISALRSNNEMFRIMSFPWPVGAEGGIFNPIRVGGF